MWCFFFCLSQGAWAARTGVSSRAGGSDARSRRVVAQGCPRRSREPRETQGLRETLKGPGRFREAQRRSKGLTPGRRDLRAGPRGRTSGQGLKAGQGLGAGRGLGEGLGTEARGRVKAGPKGRQGFEAAPSGRARPLGRALRQGLWTGPWDRVLGAGFRSRGSGRTRSRGSGFRPGPPGISGQGLGAGRRGRAHGTAPGRRAPDARDLAMKSNGIGM